MASTNKNLSQVLSVIDNINPYASTLSEGCLSIVDAWIDTGSYALNAIISGSLYKGIPSGRIVGLAGPSGCGKTLLINKIIGNFQKLDPENWAIVFDTENAEDAGSASSVGADPTRIKHVPVETVGECRDQLFKILDSIIENKLQGKFIIAIDSLGNLAGDKEMTDAEKGSNAVDMGTRARSIKSMLRVITLKAAKAKTTILFSNHTYDDPTAMYASAVQNQSGGKGPMYMASVLVQLALRREKNKDDFANEEILAAAKDVGGITMRALTPKNRFIPPMLETEVYLNFKTGLNRYSGLFELAKGLEVITGSKTYECDGHKLGFRKQLEKKYKVWDTIIMPKLEEKLIKEFAFSNVNDIIAESDVDYVDEDTEADE